MADIETFIEEGVQYIHFNRPHKRNALTKKMLEAVIQILNQSIENDNVKVAVLSGCGDFYSSGNDFSLLEGDVHQGLAVFQQFVATLIDYPKLLVAVVGGPAIGMACTTLGLFDIVYASDKAYFQTPFTLLGLVAEGCSSYTFPRLFGPAKAARMLYLNDVMPVNEALISGLITQVFPHCDLFLQAYIRITELASLPFQSLKLTKSLMRCWDRKKLHLANREETKALLTRFQSEEFFSAISNPDTLKRIKNKL